MDASAVMRIQSSEKGHGIARASVTTAASNGIVSEALEYGIVQSKGLHRLRVCSRCFAVASKMKQREDCPNLSFCSHECLAAASPLLDACGLAMSQLLLGASSSSLSFVDMQQLALVVYFHFFHSRRRRRNLLNDDFETHVARESLPETRAAASELHALLSATHSSLLATATIDALEHVLRIVQFNSQVVFLPQLPTTTSLLVFSPLFAKVNHSCAPNCVLRLDSGPRLTLVMLNDDLAAGEELFICYLAQACSSLTYRRQLLQQAFYFTCACTRCCQEEQSSQGMRLTKHGQGAFMHASLGGEPIEDVVALYDRYDMAMQTMHMALRAKTKEAEAEIYRATCVMISCWQSSRSAPSLFVVEHLLRGALAGYNLGERAGGLLLAQQAHSFLVFLEDTSSSVRFEKAAKLIALLS